jgi:hypothetical protein
MAVSSLQREAFRLSPEFNQQVDGVVQQQALYQAEQLDPEDPNTPLTRDRMASVVRSPQTYGFTPAVVADAGWVITYDAWAADPAGAEGAILAGVQKVWPLLVGG